MVLHARKETNDNSVSIVTTRSSGRCDIDPEPSIQRTIDKRPFDLKAIERAAYLLGGTLRIAPFRLPEADVWQVDVPGHASDVALTLTLWPSINRVDARSPHLMVVVTEIEQVELVEGVEVVFRRSNGEYLIVPIGGKVIVRA